MATYFNIFPLLHCEAYNIRQFYVHEINKQYTIQIIKPNAFQAEHSVYGNSTGNVYRHREKNGFCIGIYQYGRKKKLFSNNYQHWHTTKFNIRPFNIQLAPSFFTFFCNIANFFPHLDYDSIVKKAQHGKNFLFTLFVRIHNGIDLVLWIIIRIRIILRSNEMHSSYEINDKKRWLNACVINLQFSPLFWRFDFIDWYLFMLERASNIMHLFGLTIRYFCFWSFKIH